VPNALRLGRDWTTYDSVLSTQFMQQSKTKEEKLTEHSARFNEAIGAHPIIGSLMAKEVAEALKILARYTPTELEQLASAIEAACIEGADNLDAPAGFRERAMSVPEIIRTYARISHPFLEMLQEGLRVLFKRHIEWLDDAVELAT
jgi:hypothetical protein